MELRVNLPNDKLHLPRPTGLYHGGDSLGVTRSEYPVGSDGHSH